MVTDIAATVTHTLGEARTTPTTIYEPWTDGWAIGFKCTNIQTGAVWYAYLNPSTDEPGDEGSTPDVFVYSGATGQPEQDVAVCFVSVGEA